MLRIAILTSIILITLTTPCLSDTLQSVGVIDAYFSPRGGATGTVVNINKNILIDEPNYANNTSTNSGTISKLATEAAIGQSQSQTAVAVNNAIDWNGIWTDSGVLLGGQFAVCGILYTMPESVTQWTDKQKNHIFKHYGENFVDPVWDKDAFYMNYILHPYWGSAYYIRGRERGLDQFSSFVYSALLSAAFEFGSECFFEKPSFQDLIVTPTAGALLGVFVFEPLRDYIKHKPELYWYDHAVLILTDPIGVLSLGFEEIFGLKTTIMVDYTPLPQQKHATGAAFASTSDYIGATWKFQWD